MFRDKHAEYRSVQQRGDIERPRNSLNHVHEDEIAPNMYEDSSGGRLGMPPTDSRQSSSAEEHLTKEPAQHSKAVATAAGPILRYRRTSTWLLACYLPFLILPWILTNIMASRPPSLPGYYVQKAENCGTRAVAIIFWFAFVRILNSIASILVVPITSALLAHGAVVFTQRRKAKQKKLDLRQTFALSDHGWSDVRILWSAWKGKGTASRYLTASAGLLIINVLLQPVQQALLNYEIIGVMTCADHPFNGPPILGYDPEPKDLSLTPQNAVIPDLIKSLATVTDTDVQPYLWRDTTSDWSTFQSSDEGSALGSTFWAPYNSDERLTYFVTAFQNNSSTGVLREHVMRLNSTAECKAIDASDFPVTCDGPDPLVVSYSSQVDPSDFSYAKPKNFTIDVCVPGNLSASPWTLSRNRQDITEDLFIKVQVDDATVQAWGYWTSAAPATNFTVHCTANTTRGYFEMPNYHNQFTAGPLLEKWPDNVTLENEFNDYLSSFSLPTGIPSTIDNHSDIDYFGESHFNPPLDPFDRDDRLTPGPLQTTALALFGRDSFFYMANNASTSDLQSITQSICQAGNVPFIRLDGMAWGIYEQFFSTCDGVSSDYSYSPGNLDQMLYQWFSTFNPTINDITLSNNYPQETLEVSMFFANQHWLLETVKATKYLYSARTIWTAPGLLVAKPVVPLYAKITVSVLMALQLFGLGLLLWYIYSVPTWTEKLDSCAIAQLTHNVDSDVFASIRKPDEKALQELKGHSGIVGVDEENLKSDGGSSSSDEGVSLVRGGTGLITRQHGSLQDWKPQWKFGIKKRKAIQETTV